jgi:DNA polymerase II large subunit
MKGIDKIRQKLYRREIVPEDYKQYLLEILNKLDEAYSVASRAREKGFDPTTKVESEPAFDVADRVEKLLNVSVAERLAELLKQYRTEKAALIIAEEVALGKFGYLDTETALNLAIRVGLAVVTDGVTVAPIQGVSSVKIKKNDDGTNYVAVYFAGPIRSAGGTEAAFTLVIADHIRKALGLAAYKANQEEVDRFVEELRVYEREIGNFQYFVSDEDVRYVLSHIPVEPTGVETDPVEVVVHRGLSRIETDRVRGGALRVVNDGLIGRSRKLLKLLQDLGIVDWDWLEKLKGGLQKGSDETAHTSSHFEEVISGRPVLSFPKSSGGFRLRYGRCFNTGLSTIGIHPATAAILDYPIVPGTQVKVDLPGKAATIAFVDTIEPPLVRLSNGKVVKVKDYRKAKELSSKVEKIIFLGDILISYGDFLENNHILLPSPYVEEWWAQELEKLIKERFGSFKSASSSLNINEDKLKKFVKEPLTYKPRFDEALNLSLNLNLPIHPSYNFFWEEITPAQILKLRNKILVKSEDTLIVPRDSELKDILERLCVEHDVLKEGYVVQGEQARALRTLLNIKEGKNVIQTWKNIFELIKALSGFDVKPKGAICIGIRVGRPEKAMQRKMKPPVHLLFPVGLKGGSTRDLVKAAQNGKVYVELVNSICSVCKSYSPSSKCKYCNGKVEVKLTCPICSRELKDTDTCPVCKIQGVKYARKSFDLNKALKEAEENVGYAAKPPLKGVQGLTNESKYPEAIEKGLLRNKYSLSVYKDGTIRFDATNCPLTHFRPKQIGVGVKKLRELGYTHDIYGKELTSDEQIVELKPQDVVLPKNALEHLYNVSKFVDEILEKLYKLKGFYNATKPEDLIGRLIVGLAPHTSVGIIGRIVGFTHSQTCLAHPYWHSAKRRDCDGDGDSIILLLDVLLNFSKEFLPEQIGGLMDTPLLLQPIVLPEELQRQAHNFDAASNYPLKFYEATLNSCSPQEVEEVMNTVRMKIKQGKQFLDFGFTHSTSVIITDRQRSSYSLLKSIPDKIDRQIQLAKKIRAVKPDDVVLSVLKTHIIPDIIGNIKAYTTQNFKCKSCGASYRRLPLKGKCIKCNGELQLTVTRGGVEKYLNIGKKLCNEFNVGEYIKNRLELIVKELELTFPKKDKEQMAITEFT